jgi:NAD(P)-dependent dehydrogenase (short-subunit alcohol dehydrogenase family)
VVNVVAVNLTGSFLCAQHAFRMMKSQSRKAGASSTMARSRPMCPDAIHPYVATKHALTG